jgi:hypothetical protein
MLDWCTDFYKWITAVLKAWYGWFPSSVIAAVVGYVHELTAWHPSKNVYIGILAVGFSVSVFEAWRKEHKGWAKAEQELKAKFPRLALSYDRNATGQFTYNSGLFIHNDGSTPAFVVQLEAEMINGVTLVFEDLPIERVESGSRVPVTVREARTVNDGMISPMGGLPGNQISSFFGALVQQDAVKNSVEIKITYSDSAGSKVADKWEIKHGDWPSEHIWCERI